MVEGITIDKLVVVQVVVANRYFTITRASAINDNITYCHWMSQSITSCYYLLKKQILKSNVIIEFLWKNMIISLTLSLLCRCAYTTTFARYLILRNHYKTWSRIIGVFVLMVSAGNTRIMIIQENLPSTANTSLRGSVSRVI